MKNIQFIKKSLWVLFIITIFACNNKSSSPIYVGEMEVMDKDLNLTSWFDASKQALDKGKGWRLPTKNELNILFQNKDKLLDIDTKAIYLSSTRNDDESVWGQSFVAGYQLIVSKDISIYNVRLVRTFDFKSESTINNDKPKIVSLNDSVWKCGNLDVMKTDCQPMNWVQANLLCQNLGFGWRLPSKEELLLLFKSKNEIGKFSDKVYWSSVEFDSNDAWFQHFGTGYQNHYTKFCDFNIRLVRSN